MVNKQKTQKILRKLQPIKHKVTPIGFIGKEPLVLPNYSGVKKFSDERDNLFLSGNGTDNHVVRWDGTNAVQDSPLVIEDDGKTYAAADSSSYFYAGSAWTFVSGGNITWELGDKVGNRAVNILDSDSSVVCSIGSTGVVTMKNYIRYTGTNPFYIYGGNSSGDDMYLYANDIDATPYVVLVGTVGVGINVTPTGAFDVKSRGTNTDVQRWVASDGSRLGRFTETGGGHGWFEVDDAAASPKFLVRADGGNNYSNAGNFGFGTITPTIPVSVSETVGFTALGGLAIKLINNTGVATVQGNIVKADPALAGGVTLTAAGDLHPIGVFLNTGTANLASAWVVVGGIAIVLIDAAACVAGDRIITAGGLGIGLGTPNNAPAVAVHFQEVGHCIVGSGGAAGPATVVLHFN